MSPQKSQAQQNEKLIERPPVVVVVGHVDHGKSTLLDYIRKSNIVEKEKGGITQHIAAYKATHKDSHGQEKKITFIDTPGHEAFKKMRIRGTDVADIAILVIAAPDGVKAQTIEAIKAIKKSGIPYVVALNKIDKPEANVEKVKQELSEHDVFVEGYGGDVPIVAISAKTGEGVAELLDMLLLVAELEELRGDPTIAAEGIVIESHRDPRRGISATLIIKNGILKKGMYVVAGDSFSPVRSIGIVGSESRETATFSSPIQIIGFNTIPAVGVSFLSYHTRKEAETYIKNYPLQKERGSLPYIKKGEVGEGEEKEEEVTVPLIIKADTLGSLEAIEHEIDRLKVKNVTPLILHKGVGNVSESDLKRAGSGKNTIIIGFNVSVETTAQELSNRLQIPIHIFEIIYKLTESLEKELIKKKPKTITEETIGKAKIIRIFSKTKNKQVVGGKVIEGKLVTKGNVKILRRDFEIGNGEIIELQHKKIPTKEVKEGLEFGAMIEARHDIAEGDTIEVFVVSEK